MTYEMLLLFALLGVGQVLAQTPTLSLIVMDFRVQTTSAPLADILGSVVSVNSGMTTVEVGCASGVPFQSCLVDRMNVTQGSSSWGFAVTGRPNGGLLSEGVSITQACQLSTPAGKEICTWVGPKGYGAEPATAEVSTPTVTRTYTTDVLSAYIRNVTITSGAERLSGSTAATATSSSAGSDQTAAATTDAGDDKSAASIAVRSNFLIAAVAAATVMKLF